MGAFHAYDIRGIYGVDFDSRTAYAVGRYIPELMQVDRVLVGMDMRLSSPEIKENLVKGITDSGADVCDMGLATTPMVYYATASDGFWCSVQITASHNPKEYNGMKISAAGAVPVGYEDGLSILQKWIEDGRPYRVSSEPGRVFRYDVTDRYLDFLRSYMTDLSCLDICMDLSNGMACLLAEKVFGSVPRYMFSTMDGSFPNHEANPLVPENTAALRKAVLENGSDVGVIYDGDADRVMFVDDRGRFVSPDLVIALLGNCFSLEGAHVLQDIRSSKAVAEYLEPMGATVHTWKVGRAFAAKKMRELDCVFGGELAGHYYFRDFHYSDSGMLASILVLGVVADFKKRGISFSDVVDSIGKYRNSGEMNFRIDRKDEAIECLVRNLPEGEVPVAVYDFDGYRLEFGDWWFNVRKSNTEPYLRFIAEAVSQEKLDHVVSRAEEILGKF